MAQFNYRGTEVFLIVLLSMFLLMAYTIFRILPSATQVERYRIEHFDPAPPSAVEPAP